MKLLFRQDYNQSCTAYGYLHPDPLNYKVLETTVGGISDGEVVPDGNWLVDSHQLAALISTGHEVHVQVLNLGSLRLDASQVVYNLIGQDPIFGDQPMHAMIYDIKITLVDGMIIINNPHHIG